MNQILIKKFVKNSKEIRRQIITAGFNSVADWSRSVGLDYNLLKMQLSGRRPISQALLEKLHATKITIELGDTRNVTKPAKQVYSRTTSRNRKIAKRGKKGTANQKAVRNHRNGNSLSDPAI